MGIVFTETSRPSYDHHRLERSGGCFFLRLFLLMMSFESIAYSKGMCLLSSQLVVASGCCILYVLLCAPTSPPLFNQPRPPGRRTILFGKMAGRWTRGGGVPSCLAFIWNFVTLPVTLSLSCLAFLYFVYFMIVLYTS